MIDEERQQRDNTVAERYALQHRHDAQMPQSPVASHYVAQPVNAESDKEYQDGALCNLPRHRRRPFETEFAQRKKRGDSHDIKEEGKHQVAGRHAVPFRVCQWREGISRLVVHQNHSCHGDASEHVERREALVFFLVAHNLFFYFTKVRHSAHKCKLPPLFLA